MTQKENQPYARVRWAGCLNEIESPFALVTQSTAMPQRLRLPWRGMLGSTGGPDSPLWNRSLPGDARVTDARLSVVDVRLNAGVADVRRRYGPLENALSSGDHQIELRPSGNAPGCVAACRRASQH